MTTPPGVRPIGICEVMHLIVTKAILSVTKGTIMEALGPLQLCAGQPAGTETAIHAVQKWYQARSRGGVSGDLADFPSRVRVPLWSTYLCIIVIVGCLGVVVQADVRGDIVDKFPALSQLNACDLASISTGRMATN